MKGTVRTVDRVYDYKAGTSGTVSPVGRVTSWSAYATAAGATVTINGGDAIPVPVGGSISGQASGEHLKALINPTFVFTGTAGYFIELLT